MSAPRISHDGRLIVPVCGSRFIDRPRRDLRPYGALACLASAIFTISAIWSVLRFVAVL